MTNNGTAANTTQVMVVGVQWPRHGIVVYCISPQQRASRRCIRQGRNAAHVASMHTIFCFFTVVWPRASNYGFRRM